MDYSFLSSVTLFQGMTEAELAAVLSCLKSSVVWYEKNQMIYAAGSRAAQIGVVLSGAVLIEQDDVWGNRSILDKLETGQVFGETYACLPDEPLMVTVTADQRAQILFLNLNQALHTCTANCVFHNRLIDNLLRILAFKNLALSRKISHTAPKTIRDKLLAYFSFYAMRQGTLDFVIPFNRQQLADYLSVDRSALSAELSKMQKDGLILYHKNHFTLISGPPPVGDTAYH